MVIPTFPGKKFRGWKAAMDNNDQKQFLIIYYLPDTQQGIVLLNTHYNPIVLLITVLQIKKLSLRRVWDYKK